MVDPVAPTPPLSITPSTPNYAGFRFPGIPNPGDTLPQMQAAVRALKESVELLTGQIGDNRALVKADIRNSLPTGPAGPNHPPNPDPSNIYGILDDALDQFHRIFTKDLVEINNIISNDLADAIAAFQAGDASVNGRVDTLQIATNNNAAAITNEALVRSTADTAFAVQINTVSAVANGKNKVFVGADPPTATAVGDIWIDTIHNNLMKTWDGTAWVARQDGAIAANASAIQVETAARANADSAIAVQITTLFSTANSNTAAITSESATRANADSALTLQFNSLNATVGNQAAALTTETAARVNADNALSGQVTTAQASVNNATASGSYRLLAVAASMSGVAAEFAVQLSATGGTGVFSNAGLRMQVLGTGQSRILFNADQFIVNVNGGPKVPFTIEGSNLVFGGAIHASALFAHEITSAHIQTQSIIVDSIAVGTLTGDRIAANTIAANNLIAKTITAASGVIGNLAVDTLQVAGNAITVPVAFFGGGFSGSGANIVNVVSGSVIITGIPGSLISVFLTLTWAQGYGGNATSTMTLVGNNVILNSVSIQTQQNVGSMTGLVQFTSNGTDNVTFNANWFGQNGNVSLQNSNIVAVAVKR